MVAKRKIVAARVFSDEEVEQAARELVVRAPGLSGSDFKKELEPDYRKIDKRVIEAANQLAARREIYRWSSAKKLRFFVCDPFDALAHSVANALSNGPLSEAELRLRVETVQRGFGDLLKDWMKGALARGDLYAHPPLKGSRLKRYGSIPDIRDLLKKVLVELKKVISTPAGQRIAKAGLFATIAEEVNTVLPGIPEPKGSAREQFLVELCKLALEGKTEGLLSIRELRTRLPFDKQQFDRLALELVRDELVTMHYHDFPTSLSETDRAELVVDARGNHFVGIALQRAQ